MHLAAENRPKHKSAFDEVNSILTNNICNVIREEFSKSGRRVKLIFASSTQVDADNEYGISKLVAEKAVLTLAEQIGCEIMIFRLPGVFGKWSRPEYNSVVATFCYNIARDIPINIHDPNASVRLVYIDDVVNCFIKSLRSTSLDSFYGVVEPEYVTTITHLADQIRAFKSCRGGDLLAERVGTGFTRALYATYLSFIPKHDFSYLLPAYEDARGRFVEVLKTHDSGQFSFFTAPPAVTRGGHYHHTKSEKFIVLQGTALFKFRHLLTNEVVELTIAEKPVRVVDTVPGWVHDVTNVGDVELIVMLWANENFDRLNPDVIPSEV